jgi:hypothetical protein
MPTRIHVVQKGECISTIALANGFRDFRAVYDHADNAHLRKKRPDPNLIHPGDEVAIPEREEKAVSVATTATHKFVLHVPTRVLRLVLVADDGAPLRSIEYVLRVRGEERKGTTDGGGMLKETIPTSATHAELETEDRIWQLSIGHLNPVEDTPDLGVSGLQARLRNLGYVVGPVDGLFGTRTRAALQAFQGAHGLKINGRLDDATRAKLREVHGS